MDKVDMARQRRKPTSDTALGVLPDAQSDTRQKPNMSTNQSSGSDSAESGQWSTRTQWIFYAVASGICAAANGAFAKLTTTELTTTLSNAIANGMGLSDYQDIVDYGVRAIFFVLNLIFNGIMWSLFTTALARGTSATQVSIMNTSTNFMVTAFLGMVIFSEKLPPLWWAGASLLVVGNVITGRKNDGDESAPAAVTVEAEPLIPIGNDLEGSSAAQGKYKGDSDSDVPDLPM
ncbi:hypothetical protein NQ176_g3032 [Zarea fungicola]|uniref:Uncharacterized protein n=1 Tax=Zarea fungicola TaxID=93591 RepID=A0ACC1NL55_9HYPO|nr:hypothetical protein NQ176_g3032 [Lecanicillium fungicola]